MNSVRLLSAFFISFITCSTFAWDYEGHRWVNQLALQSLPTNFPSFVKTPEAAERIAFLAGEADRWKNQKTDLPLKHCNDPDHYLDLEYLADHGIDVNTLTRFRYEFAAQLAAGRAKNLAKLEPIDPAKNEDRTRELIGFLPWTISEYYGKLKSGFSYLKAYEESGTPEEIVNAQQNIIYIMGVMGHFIGDAVQPLHSTKHFNGWVGENPKGYSTRKTFHAWIDGGFISRSGIQFSDLSARIKPAGMLWADSSKQKPDIFVEVMAFLREQHKLVEPIYILEKENKFDGKNPSEEGKEFLKKQLVVGGQMLGTLWHTAWQQAGPDVYLRGKLLDRQVKQAEKK